MKTIKLNLFDSFECIASNCKYSCCNAGWQIDVDKKTMQKYSLSDDLFTQNIRYHIVQKDKQYCIDCDKNGRCPFFRDDGLCDIVKNKGDGYLCEVCRDFPRISTAVGDRVEKTLSFSCEEVVRMILSQQKIDFEYQNTKKEFLLSNKDFKERDNLINYLQNDNQTFCIKIENLKSQCKFEDIDFGKMKSVLKNCEWLKNDFSSCDFEKYICEAKESFCLRDNQLENILVCYLFRYFLHPRFKAYSQNAKLRFCIFSVLFCDYLAVEKQKKKDERFDVNAIKEYSREIENSEKNVNILLNFFNS